MSVSNQDLSNQLMDARLAQAFYSNNRYNALFLGVTGAGFIVIYLLTSFNIFGVVTPQLLYISGAMFLLALVQLPVMQLARRGRGISASLFGTLSVAAFAILLTTFWEGIVPAAMLVVLITPLMAVLAGIPRRFYSLLLLIVAASAVGILYANANPLIDRLQASSTTSVVSLAFLGTSGLLFITVVFIARNRNYASLRTQLLVSFLLIVTIPTLLATILSAVGAYVNNEAQTLDTLETVAKLKENQIAVVLDRFRNGSASINRDTVFARSIRSIVLSSSLDPDTLALYTTSARNRLLEYQSSQEQVYEEIMVLNVQGQVLVSTDISREGKSLQSEAFYREGSLRAFAGFSKNPTFGKAGLVYSSPLYDEDGKIIRGILVLRANSGLITEIMENTPGVAEMETYLLDKDYYPLTKTRRLTQTVNTQASESILSSTDVQDGRGTYENYAGEIVLGYYRRVDALNAAFIAEIPRSYILQNSIRSLLGSAALATFAIIIAIAAVAVSAASIAEPISALAMTAENFAEGRFAARAAIERRDEIGALSKAYDQMAEQLQDIIGKLEQRVADRTREFQDQTLRLRISAEIARDAASSHTLSELLDRAVTLIQNRFELYHTGIFLLDNNNDYAILVASPTSAGAQMIASKHKLRVGEAGIVGRVAATGEPRISLDTGSDVEHFNNPLLPKTRSEMALPLKVENRMIGVLDVQSDQPQAFDENDAAIMQILADQLATAIERTRLLQQVEQNLSDLEQAYGQFTREGWKTFEETSLLNKPGYRFDNIRIQPITEAPVLGAGAMRTGTIVTENSDNNPSAGNQVAIPIRLRGQIIGVVTAHLKGGYAQNTISTLELAVERLALSLESARLYEEARLRADREQTIAQVATTISSASEFDAILRTTVEEIGKVLGDSEVSIQIIRDADQASN